MYDSMNFGLVSSSEIVLGGMSCRFGISNSLLMSRRYAYIASSKSGWAMASTISSGWSRLRSGNFTNADSRSGKETRGSIARASFA